MPLPMPFDWDTPRSADEWREVAYEFAKMWSLARHSLLADPSFVRWLATQVTDTKLFHLDDPQWQRKYVAHLDAKR